MDRCGDQYGLGFELIDSSSGIFFKDSTTLIKAFDKKHYEYIHTNKATKAEFTCDIYNSESLPPRLEKKQMALKKHANYIAKHLSDAISSPARKECLPEHLIDPPPYTYPSDQSSLLPFITKFFRTRRATLFRLSTCTIQINFKNTHVKLILSNQGRVFTKISPSGRARTRYLLDIIREYKLSRKKYREPKPVANPKPSENNSSSPKLAPSNISNKDEYDVIIEQVYEHIEYLKDVLKYAFSKKQKLLPR